VERLLKSPFPGMDPYLESHWGDIHHSLIAYARETLQAVLPRDLRARVEERVFLEATAGFGRRVIPDVRVVEHRPATAPVPATASAVAIAEPLTIVLADEPTTQGYIEIRDLSSGSRVVTVIEVLSPSNKLPGEGRRLYVHKQRELVEAGVSLVEIDLVRTGRRVLRVPQARIPPSHRTPYQVCVSRGWHRDQVDVYRVPLRERLPVILVPLRETDPEVALDLQALLDRAYETGGYDDLDYTIPPEPPLGPEDARWADDLLRAAGLR